MIFLRILILHCAAMIKLLISAYALVAEGKNFRIFIKFYDEIDLV